MKCSSLFAAALIFFSNPALASDGSWKIGNDQIHLVYSDVDLRTQEGRSKMLDRVQRAAAELCRDLPNRIDQLDCRKAAVATAAAQPGGSWLRLAIADRGGIAMASNQRLPGLPTPSSRRDAQITPAVVSAARGL